MPGHEELATPAGLNDLDRRILEIIKKHGVISRKELHEKGLVAGQTLQNSIQRLLELGAIERIVDGKEHRYRLPMSKPDVEKALKPIHDLQECLKRVEEKFTCIDYHWRMDIRKYAMTCLLEFEYKLRLAQEDDAEKYKTRIVDMISSQLELLLDHQPIVGKEKWREKIRNKVTECRKVEKNLSDIEYKHNLATSYEQISIGEEYKKKFKKYKDSRDDLVSIAYEIDPRIRGLQANKAGFLPEFFRSGNHEFESEEFVSKWIELDKLKSTFVSASECTGRLIEYLKSNPHYVKTKEIFSLIDKAKNEAKLLKSKHMSDILDSIHHNVNSIPVDADERVVNIASVMKLLQNVFNHIRINSDLYEHVYLKEIVENDIEYSIKYYGLKHVTDALDRIRIYTQEFCKVMWSSQKSM